MREIVPGVYLVEGLQGANVYLLASDEGLALVDSGVTGEAARIVAEIRSAGLDPANVHTIVLTHAHGDHTGSAAGLARDSGAQVLAHGAEAPYIAQARPLPAATASGRLMNWLSNRVLFRQPPCPVDRTLADGDNIETLGGLRVIHTPGHTPGSISLYQAERKLLFCGDALFNRNPLTGRAGLQLPLRLVSSDNAQARESAGRLAGLPLEVLCCGHGEPILAGAGEQVKALLQVT